MRPNPSLKRRPATAATVWRLQAAVNIILAPPAGVCLRGLLSSNVRPHNRNAAVDTELDTTPLFAELGRALYVFQAIEARIKLLLPHLNLPGAEEPPSDEGWNGRRKYLDSKEMLGNLVKLFQQRMTISQPELLEQAWREIVQGRNDVVHNFVLQPFAACGSREDYERSLEYIRQRRLRALPLFQMLDTLLRGFVAVLELPPDFVGDIPVELPSWYGTSAA